MKVVSIFSHLIKTRTSLFAKMLNNVFNQLQSILISDF